MSAIIERFIKCDHCNVNFGVDMRHLTIEQHRKSAKSEGWTTRRGKDFCGMCSQIENKMLSK